MRSADKHGELEALRADAAIVFAENRPYVISVVTTYLHNERDCEEAIARISRAACRMFNRLGRPSVYGRVVSTQNSSHLP